MNPENHIPNFLPGRARALRWLQWTCAAGALLCAASLRAQTTNNNATPSFETFHILEQKNIFDPNRRGIYHPGPRPPSNNNHRPVVDAFALVGTMSYTKGKFAFFDGTSSQYKKVLQPGGNIIGYTVKDITTTNVLLAANGKDFPMTVGSQLRKDASSGVWRMSTGGTLPTDSGSSPTSDQNIESSTDQSPPTGSSAEMTEILKRMAERRNQELSK